MKKIFSRPLYYILAGFAAFACLVGIVSAFANSMFLSNVLEKSLSLRISPSFIGGETAEAFFDPLYDDKGSGYLTYPGSKAFEKGCFDIVRYIVHEPVYQAQWQTAPEYWQLDLEFYAGSNDLRNIMIYIDADGDENGALDTLVESAENVCFDPAHPWDYAISVHGAEGALYGSDKNFIEKVEVAVQSDGKLLHIRIPLALSILQHLYTEEKTYHYVLCGAWSQWDRGGFMPIEERRSVSRGGTESSDQWAAIIPKVYDYLDVALSGRTEAGSGENICLATWDADSLEKARMIPVVSRMRAEKNDRRPHNAAVADLDSAKKELAAVREKEFQTLNANYALMSTDADGVRACAIAAFNCGKLTEAEKNFIAVLEEKPSDIESLAYMGSLIAMKASDASVIEAVALVNKAYTYLDKAADVAVTDDEVITALMNRGSVSFSVPNAVFGKALSGAQDFLRCAEIYRTSKISQDSTAETTIALADMYLKASACFVNAGKTGEAKVWYLEAERLFKVVPEEASEAYLALKVQLLEQAGL